MEPTCKATLPAHLPARQAPEKPLAVALRITTTMISREVDCTIYDVQKKWIDLNPEFEYSPLHTVSSDLGVAPQGSGFSYSKF